MSKEAIIERILSDADAECEEILRLAREQAEARIAEANAQAEEELAETEREAAERAARIADGKAATARLDSAKILLSEKRRVLDEIYARALEELGRAEPSEKRALVARLLQTYAEEGDEVVLAEGEDEEAVRRLPVFSARSLTLAPERAAIGGGVILRGKRCDQDLSFAALLKADAEAYQAELAAKLFR